MCFGKLNNWKIQNILLKECKSYNNLKDLKHQKILKKIKKLKTLCIKNVLITNILKTHKSEKFYPNW